MAKQEVIGVPREWTLISQIIAQAHVTRLKHMQIHTQMVLVAKDGQRCMRILQDMRVMPGAKCKGPKGQANNLNNV